VGDWIAGQRHGFGQLDAAGSTYIGEFDRGTYEGVGYLRSPAGYYVGHWRAGRRDGLGEQASLAGRYMGEWSADQHHGRAIVRSEDGQELGLVYEAGVRVGSLTEDEMEALRDELEDLDAEALMSASEKQAEQMRAYVERGKRQVADDLEVVKARVAAMNSQLAVDYAEMMREAAEVQADVAAIMRDVGQLLRSCGFTEDSFTSASFGSLVFSLTELQTKRVPPTIKQKAIDEGLELIVKAKKRKTLQAPSKSREKGRVSLPNQALKARRLSPVMDASSRPRMDHDGLLEAFCKDMAFAESKVSQEQLAKEAAEQERLRREEIKEQEKQVAHDIKLRAELAQREEWLDRDRSEFEAEKLALRTEIREVRQKYEDRDKEANRLAEQFQDHILESRKTMERRDTEELSLRQQLASATLEAETKTRELEATKAELDKLKALLAIVKLDKESQTETAEKVHKIVQATRDTNHQISQTEKTDSATKECQTDVAWPVPVDLGQTKGSGSKVQPEQASNAGEPTPIVKMAPGDIGNLSQAVEPTEQPSKEVLRDKSPGGQPSPEKPKDNAKTDPSILPRNRQDQRLSAMLTMNVVNSVEQAHNQSPEKDPSKSEMSTMEAAKGGSNEKEEIKDHPRDEVGGVKQFIKAPGRTRICHIGGKHE
jgi:hypothetical protein